MPLIQALFFEPDKSPVVREVEDTRMALRGLVGHPSEMGTLPLERWRSGRAIEAFCNDGGQARGLAPCVFAAGPDFQGAAIFGPLVVMRLSNYRKGFFESLEPEEIAFYSKLPLLTPLPHALPRAIPFRMVNAGGARAFMLEVLERRRRIAAQGERAP